MSEKQQNLPGLVSALFQPRMLLMIWGGLGALFIVWVMVSAMIPKGKPGGAVEVSRDLLTGEMADFEPAFPPRGMPVTPIEGPAGPMVLSDFKGKVTVVNLWATWCPPCLYELPSLDQLQSRFDKGEMEVVAISVEAGAKEKAPPMFDRLGIENLSLYTDSSMQLAFAVGGADVLPVTIIYDRQGMEVGRLVGDADWASAEAEALVRAVLLDEDIS